MTAGLILAAGLGKRMRSRMPKVLFPLLGRRLLDYPLKLLEDLGCDPRVVVVGHGADSVRSAYEVRPLTWALPDPPPGTGAAAPIGPVARAPDGTIEAIECLENRWLIGVQWLPELTAADEPRQQRLFDDFVAATMQ